MRRTALALMPLAHAIRSAVQWVVSTGGSASVSAARPPPDRAEGCARAASGDAFLHEPFLPAPDAGLRLAGPAHIVGPNTVGAREDDRRPPKRVSARRYGAW